MRASNCSGCGAKLVAGARFCTSCGAAAGSAESGARARGPARGAAAGRSDGTESNLPWYIAGAVLLVLVLFLGLPMVMDDANRTVPAPGTATLGGATAPGALPALTGTPREQADRLFNRVMAAREQGNSAEALQFAPMGIQAYQMAEPLDNDGLYHMATLQNTVSDFTGARATAERTLAGNPNHLLALAAAAEAATGSGDAAAAREYHERFLAAYQSELARDLPEYQDHARILPEYRQAAIAATQ